MKLIRFGKAGKEKPGVLLEDGVRLDVSAFGSDYNEEFFAGNGLWRLARWLEKNCYSLPGIDRGVRLGSPICRPNKIVCVGLNFRDHAMESGMPIPDEPVLFFKSTTALVGPDDDLVIPRNAHKVDWEVEVAVIIGKQAKYVPRENALEFIAGYALHNDYSERSFQLERGGQWVKGKSADTFAPLGPYVATTDEVPDTSNLEMWLTVNGTMRQKSTTAQMIFDVPSIVSYCTEFMTPSAELIVVQCAFGTPTDFGSFSYTVTVTDSSTPVQTDSGQGLLNIAQQLQILAYLSPAYINRPYSSSFTSIGGSFPVAWSIRSGNLPPGLTLSANGNVFGTATQLGAYNFVVQATDSGTPPYIVTQAITLNVTPTPLNIAGALLSPAPVNVIYHSQIPASGGTPPYSWSIISGSLPLGLTLNAATGFIDGTPTQNGTYNFTVRGADSSNPVQTATANEFIVIQRPLGRNDSIATATPLGNSQNVSNPVVLSVSPYIDPIGAATANPDTDFYKLVAAGGGIVHVETFAQRSWATNPLDTVIEVLDQNGARLHSCTQPNYAASCLNDDIDSSTRDSALDLKVPGAPNATTTFYVHVLDWRGDARPDMLYYLNISGVIELLTISPSTLGAGATRGVNYQQQFTAAGGSGQVAWAVTGGALPTGWGLSSSGLLSGVATADGSYTFAIKATDSANAPQTRQVQFSLQIADPLVITTSPILPNACVNKPYTFQMLTSGGLPPIAFSAGSNTLWVGINVDPQTGLFTGSSSVTGTFMTGAGAIDSAQPPSVDGQQITLTVVNCP